MIGSPSTHMQGDKGLFHTGLFLRPRTATALQGLIRNKTIQDRAKFTVAKSQIHPNGLCEIVVKRQDPTISTNSIMELLERCHKLVEDHILPEAKQTSADMNRTIDVSDNDDSICIVSPSHGSERRISFKRSFANSSPSSVKLLSPKSNFGIEPLSKRQNLTVNINSQPSQFNQERKIVWQPKDGVDSQSFPKLPINGSGSLHPFIKGDNIVVKVFNNDNNKPQPPSPAQGDDANSSVILLDVCEDTMPSAPTWTSQGPSFPLNSISQNLSKHLAVDNSSNPSENQPSSKTGQETITQRTNACSPGVTFVSRFSDVVKENFKPKACTSVKAVEMLGKSKDQAMCTSTSGNPNGVAPLSQKEEDKSLLKTPNVSEQNVAAKLMGGAHQQVQTQPSGSVIGKEIAKCQVAGGGLDKSSSSASGELSSDDDIIIEKEIEKQPNQPPSLLIDDSDDDIAVCKVVDKVIINEPMLSKKQRKKLRKNRLNNTKHLAEVSLKLLNGGASTSAGSASTSAGPALDFIPLSSHRVMPRMGQKTPNNPQNLSRAAKLQMIHDKREKKSRATSRWNSVQSGKVDSSSGPKQSPPSGNEEKREFGGNIINPNPETPKAGLRPVVIDASNVAVGHGRAHGGGFSVRGLKICIKYFTDRGHKVFAFAPKYRRFHVSPEDRKAMDDLESQGILSFTPSRTMEDGRKVASYDDRYIVQVAAELGGVIISTDNYRDLLSENEAWRETIEQRLLMFTWVGDMLLFPNDPLGRDGPHLHDFLRFPAPAPEKK